MVARMTKTRWSPNIWLGITVISYTYLGVIFTQDGKSDSTVREHVRNKQCHIIKFLSFLSKNPDAPFSVKKTVFEAAILSTLLYGCDSWLGSSSRYANHPTWLHWKRYSESALQLHIAFVFWNSACLLRRPASKQHRTKFWRTFYEAFLSYMVSIKMKMAWDWWCHQLLLHTSLST